MTRSARVWISLVLGAWSCDCGDDASDSPNQGMRCATRCESQIWPPVLVATSIDSAIEVDVQAHGASGANYRVIEEPGCQDFPASLACTRSFRIFGGAASERQVDVTAAIGTRESTEPLSQSLELRADFCGHDVAYIALVQRSDGTFALDPARYLSPCALPDF